MHTCSLQTLGDVWFDIEAGSAPPHTTCGIHGIPPGRADHLSRPAELESNISSSRIEREFEDVRRLDQFRSPAACAKQASLPPRMRYTPPMRLKGKTALVIGAGQSPGEGMGNGHATVLRFAREGRT